MDSHKEAIGIEMEDLTSKRDQKIETQALAQMPDGEILVTTESSNLNKSGSTYDLNSARLLSLKQAQYIRVVVFLLVVTFLVLGRFSVPDNEVACIQDKAFQVFENVTRFLIATPGNEHWRDFFQIFASGLIDSVFLSVLIYWVIYGKSSRLVVSQAIFYGTRALLQKLFWAPFPPMYYWYSPPIPSLAVPYGRGSDFFYSGHAGFVVLCANEWHQLGKSKMRNYTLGVLVVTIFTLLIYRIHYTIDIFTGIVYADWAFHKVNSNKELIDGFFIDIVAKVRLFCQKRK